PAGAGRRCPPGPAELRPGEMKLGRPAVEEARQLGGGELQADEERAELAVPRTCLVEAHLVDQLLEDERVVGEKVDTPLPIVEADGTGDNLGHLLGVAAADDAM